MSETHGINVGASLLQIHHIVSRGIEVSIEKGQTFAKSGFPDDSTRAGYVNYVKSLATVLRAHHLTEDELVFPYAKEIIPEAPYETLSAEHHVLEPLLPELNAAIDRVEKESRAGAALQETNRLLAKLKEVWYPHIQKEEQFFTLEALGRLIPQEEHLRLMKVFGEHSQKLSEPGFLVLPFLLFNLSKEEREQFSKAFPPMVVEQLVPVAWKDKWASMKPFLLS